jgi:hypothetical protein
MNAPIAQHHYEMACHAGRRGPDHDYDCVVCHEPVYNQYATDLGITLEACRDCTDRRISQLLQAEKEFTAMKKEHRRLMLNAALAFQLAANEIKG